ncbi:C2 calcium-dependent domain-containing protein 6 isoform X1 [Astyanax mexicanus]|uniref:C2 calcium-dependent domain-containing protein 6 isoform X1 n=1 Tax=Astyanax mexicanus TaxID=7994 RepID=UPI0020CAADB2|nr:C2 calcium-dependent domain-containing protein 6 isoform X1 [Astyanax mexicanus]XP_022520186.2 C2 calcium-dependent domain-containing protein 6 isoform X1 [Astyanax mexicanus]
MDMKQQSEQECSPSPTSCGCCNFHFLRWALFHRRIGVQDSQSEDDKTKRPTKMSVRRLIKRLQKTGQTPVVEVRKDVRGVSSELESLQESTECSSSSQPGPEVQEKKTVPLVPLGEPVGVLSVTIKSCKDLTTFTYVKSGTLGAVRVTFGKLQRSTKLQLYKDPMIFNEKMHISVQISKEDVFGDNDSSVLMVDLLCVDAHTRVFRIMGNDTISLMEILNNPSPIYLFDLRLQDQKVGTVDAELGFTYGFMGYGYSHQITHSEKTVKSLVQKSCFLRCPPPEDQSDTHDNDVSPSTLPPVDLDSLIQSDSVSSSEPAGLVEQAIRRRARLSRLQTKWKTLESSEDRLTFLENLIMKKGPSK